LPTGARSFLREVPATRRRLDPHAPPRPPPPAPRFAVAEATPSAPAAWLALIGAYASAGDTLYVFEDRGAS